MALLPAAHTDYSTIVLEEKQSYYVRRPTTTIVNTSYLEGGATYGGRRKAVCYRT